MNCRSSGSCHGITDTVEVREHLDIKNPTMKTYITYAMRYFGKPMIFTVTYLNNIVI